MNSFRKHRPIEGWLLYLMGIIHRLPQERLARFLRDFCFKKGEKKRLLDFWQHKRTVRRLVNKKIRKKRIFTVLEPMSFETLIFFYAYYTDRTVRKHIVHYLNELCDIKLHVRGNDLKALHLAPHVLYSKALELLTLAKIEKNLTTKEQELAEVKLIFKRLKAKHPQKRSRHRR